MFYQKNIDIFAECSIDYDKNGGIAITFYKIIQNKLHYEVLEEKDKIFYGMMEVQVR